MTRNGGDREPITPETNLGDKFLKAENPSGKHHASKLPRKFVNLLYREFVAFFSA
ncbi:MULTISPECIES: hypothetical protein [Spirulina sp. CCY15215]|uniref:hypothetical protein n=1 Tax=Spirulina sp. CCY15215 TaxID=2767591 RepID=UPI001950086D|nr:hypothetical protein [Spirulina major]